MKFTTVNETRLGVNNFIEKHEDFFDCKEIDATTTRKYIIPNLYDDWTPIPSHSTRK